jgi:hypothetical protein
MRSKYLWKFKFFWDDVKNAKNDANISKFWGFYCFFTIFGFLKKFIKNMGKKLGSNMYHARLTFAFQSNDTWNALCILAKCACNINR